MSEEINNVEPQVEPQQINYSERTLAELTVLFEALGKGLDRIKKSKDAEAIKSAFYRRLSKEKAEAGLGAEVNEPAENDSVEETQEEQSPETVSTNPFEAIEAGFKSLYNEYKKEKAVFNHQAEQEKEDNLVKKQAVIDDLKALVEKQEDINATFPEFREIQNRWREIGPVPVQKFRDINDTYQFYVEKFYDMVKINHELRDLDFKKNLEVKEGFCELAEKLSEKENVVEAFKELQKLHEQWKDFGPVAKEYRDSIWERFKAATAVINKKYQAYFEEQKSKYADNLAQKEKLCEQVEEMLGQEIKSSNEWNAYSKQIEEIQKTWKTIGFAAKKDNQKIYERFRAACDKFFENKRAFYTSFKEDMNANLEKKLNLIERAEALKTSTEWKKSTDLFIALQKEWKEIGAVPRKKSEQLWKKFRAACDAFFTERDKQAKPENDFYGNLKAKKKLIEEINGYVSEGNIEADREAYKNFVQEWQSIGFVPFKEKDTINDAYRSALREKFPDFRQGSEHGRRSSAPRSEKDALIQKYHALQQDIITYENNIGFFSMSKNSEPLIKQMKDRIEKAKQELMDLETRIRNNQETPADEK